MDPGQLIPTPDPLPGPWGLFNILLVLTFFLHLLMANVLLGGGVIAMVSNLRRKAGRLPVEVGREISQKLPLTIAFTVNLGVAPLLFLQVMYGQYIYVSNVLMAWMWLSMFVLIIAGYYSAYVYKFKYDVLGGGRAWLMGITVAAMLLVGFFFTNGLVMMIDPKVWAQYFENPGGTIIHWGEASLIPRYLHFVVSSLAIGGLALAIWGWRLDGKGDARGADLKQQGLLWFGAATIVNFFIGGWYLGALPNAVLGEVIGGSRLTLLIFMISVISGLASIVFAFGGLLWHTLCCAMGTTLLMVIFRYAVRSVYMSPYLDTEKLPMAVQFTPLLLFVGALVLGVLVVIWMLKLAMKPAEGGQS